MSELVGMAGGIPGLVLALLVGYGLGSIPFGLLLTRWAGAGDIRAIGAEAGRTADRGASQ